MYSPTRAGVQPRLLPIPSTAFHKFVGYAASGWPVYVQRYGRAQWTL